MAEQWIKLDCRTHSKPEVLAIARVTKLSVDDVVGKLTRLWIWADEHSLAGASIPIYRSDIDSTVNKRGFAAAMVQVGWLIGNDGELTFPNFHRHNGTTAKARSITAKRVQSFRTRNATDTTPSPSSNAATVTPVTPPPLRERVLDKDEEEDQRESKREQARAITPTANQLRQQDIDDSDPETQDIAAYRHATALANSDWPDRIRAAYGLQDSPMAVLQCIRTLIVEGQDPQFMLAAVLNVSAIIRDKAPQQFRTKFVPSALRFFTEEQWRSPEAFENRWQKDAETLSRQQTQGANELQAAITDRNGQKGRGADDFFNPPPP